LELFHHDLAIIANQIVELVRPRCFVANIRVSIFFSALANSIARIDGLVADHVIAFLASLAFVLPRTCAFAADRVTIACARLVVTVEPIYQNSTIATYETVEHVGPFRFIAFILDHVAAFADGVACALKAREQGFVAMQRLTHLASIVKVLPSTCALSAKGFAISFACLVLGVESVYQRLAIVTS